MKSITLLTIRLGLLISTTVITAIVLDRAGPFEGWLRDTLAADPDSTSTVTNPQIPRGETSSLAESRAKDNHKMRDNIATASETSSSISQVDGDRGLEAPAQTEKERIYEELKKMHLEKLESPDIGALYSFHTRTGQVIKGKLLARDSGRLKVRVGRGVVYLPAYTLTAQDQIRYFPERTAKKLALRDMRLTMAGLRRARTPTRNSKGSYVADTEEPAQYSQAQEEVQESPKFTAAGVDATGTEETAADKDSSSPLKLQVTPAESDEGVKPLLDEFAAWIDYQNRRAGHQLAKAAYAKRQQQACVLYLILSDSFKEQPYDTRFQLAEALWQFWAFRAERSGSVEDPSDAYVVLLDSQRNVVGGSRLSDGSEIYVVN